MNNFNNDTTLAIDKIAMQITEKSKIYFKTNNPNIKTEIIQLISDRDTLYMNPQNTEILKKYLDRG